eukprot:75205-Amphidinium_carterae.1
MMLHLQDALCHTTFGQLKGTRCVTELGRATRSLQSLPCCRQAHRRLHGGRTVKRPLPMQLLT